MTGLCISVAVPVAVVVWLVYLESRRKPTTTAQQPDERGRYFVEGGPTWGQDYGYELLKEYGMGKRSAGEYRRAWEHIVDTLETEGAQLTGAIIEWEWMQRVGIVRANRAGLVNYEWARLLQNIAERTAEQGKRGIFR